MNTSFVNITFFVYFSPKEILEGLSKNNINKKQIDAEIHVTLKHAPARERAEELFYRLWQQITKPNYKLTFPSGCILLFELSSSLVIVILKYLFISEVTKIIFTK